MIGADLEFVPGYRRLGCDCGGHLTVCVGHHGWWPPAATPLSASENCDLRCAEPLGWPRLCSGSSHAVRLPGWPRQGVHPLQSAAVLCHACTLLKALCLIAGDSKVFQLDKL